MLGFIPTEHMLTADIIWLCVRAFACYSIWIYVYNLCLHPLRKFPGPKLAAASFLYEFYYDVIKDGTYLWEIQRMHRKYGPIIRINPRELHIYDPEYYSSIYVRGSRKVNKDAETVAAFAVPTSVAATVDHNHHRARRGYLNPYFSRRSIVELEPIINERIDKLSMRLELAMHDGEPIGLDSAFSALTADIITNRFYGEHFDYLGIKDFKFPVTEAFLGVSLIFHLARFLPGLVRAIRSLPIPMIRLILPSVADFLALQKEIERNIKSKLKQKGHENPKSVIVQALGDESIPPKERKIDRLLDEGTVIIFAGTETSSRALSVGMFYLLSNKKQVAKLRDELATVRRAKNDKYSLVELEALPYLTGVVNESLRLSFGPVSRLPRVATHESLQYREFVIPPGTPISQSTYFVHTDPSIYPKPFCFEPERWVRAAQAGFALDKFLTSFTKGHRQCLGVGMARAELYLTFARVISNFDMELYNTTSADVDIYHVRIVGYPRKVKGQAKGRGEITAKVTGMCA